MKLGITFGHEGNSVVREMRKFRNTDIGEIVLFEKEIVSDKQELHAVLGIYYGLMDNGICKRSGSNFIMQIDYRNNYELILLNQINQTEKPTALVEPLPDKEVIIYTHSFIGPKEITAHLKEAGEDIFNDFVNSYMVKNRKV